MNTLSQERIERIARNINKMDVNYNYTNDSKVFRFWRNLAKQLYKILDSLTEDDKQRVAELCEDKKRTYFRLTLKNPPKKKSFRAKVFKRAYEIMKQSGRTFAQCLKKSWALYRLAKQSSQNDFEFTYEKKDGTLKRAFGFLHNVSGLIKETGKTALKEFRYYDKEKVGFISFQANNLLAIH